MPRRALAVIGTLLGVVTVAAVAAALLGAFSAASRAAWSFGPFAGYVWAGPVASVSGSWTVPRIIGLSRGFAATWVGAQTPRAGGAFIQIGTREEHRPLRGEPPRAPEYAAFWSDTAHNFHPQSLFAVRAGDEVFASLELARGQWTLAVADATEGVAAHVATRSETHAAFGVAEWVQEDVTGVATGKPVSYPRLTAVSFRHLAVNSAAPAYARLYAEWMSADDRLLAPSPLRGDAFTLHPASVSSAGGRYLHIARSESAAINVLSTQARDWTPTTPYAQIASTSNRVITALGEDAHTLAGSRWPTQARAPMRSLIRSLDTLGELARPPGLRSPAGLAAWRSALSAGLVTHAADVRQVRRALLVPEI